VPAQYNFGYLPPRAGLASDLPLSHLAADILGPRSKKMKTVVPAESKNGSGAKAELERRCVDYVRVLSAEMVQAANSGHPGAPMGCAPMAHVLWNGVMAYDPKVRNHPTHSLSQQTGWHAPQHHEPARKAPPQPDVAEWKPHLSRQPRSNACLERGPRPKAARRTTWSLVHPNTGC